MTEGDMLTAPRRVTFIVGNGINRNTLADAFNQAGLNDDVSLNSYEAGHGRPNGPVVLIGDPRDFSSSLQFLLGLAGRRRVIRPSAIVFPARKLPDEFSLKEFESVLADFRLPRARTPLLLIDFDAVRYGDEMTTEQLTLLVHGLTRSQTDILNAGRYAPTNAFERAFGAQPDTWQLAMLHETTQFWSGPAGEVWLTSSTSFLDGSRPIDLIYQHDDRIQQLFVAMDQGIYS